MKLGSSSPYKRFGEESPDPVIPSLSRDLPTGLCMRCFGKLSMTREKNGVCPLPILIHISGWMVPPVARPRPGASAEQGKRTY